MEPTSLHRAARKEDLPRQQDLFQRAMAARPDPAAEAAAHYQLGRAQAQHRRFVAGDRAAVERLTEQAEACFKRSHAIACDNGAADSDLAGLSACEIAHLSFSLQNYEKACEWFDKGFDALSDDSQLMRAAFAACYGYALFAQRRYDEAERLFDRYLAEVQSVLPDRVICAALVAAGVTAALHGDVAHGLGLLDRGAEAAIADKKGEVVTTARDWRARLAPLATCTTAEEWKVAGNGFFGSGDVCAATCLYGVALTKAPFDAKILANRALCELKLGRHADALADATRARKADKTYKRALMILVNVQRDMGRVAAAARDCAELLRMDPEDAAAKQLDAELRAALAALPPAEPDHVDPTRSEPEQAAEPQQQQPQSRVPTLNLGAVPRADDDADAMDSDAEQEEESAGRACADFFRSVPIAPAVARRLEGLRARHASLKRLVVGDKKAGGATAVLSGFLQWYRGAVPEERAALLQRAFPYLPATAMVAAADEADPIACLVPELTKEALCDGVDAGSNLKRLLVGIAAAPDADALVEQAVASLMDTAEFRGKTARGAWLRAQLAPPGSTAFTEVATGRTRDAGVDPAKVPSSASAEARQELAGLRTAVASRLAVPVATYELATTRASYLLELPEAWLLDWLREHEPDHPLAAAVADDSAAAS